MFCGKIEARTLRSRATGHFGPCMSRPWCKPWRRPWWIHINPKRYCKKPRFFFKNLVGKFRFFQKFGWEVPPESDRMEAFFGSLVSLEICPGSASGSKTPKNSSVRKPQTDLMSLCLGYRPTLCIHAAAKDLTSLHKVLSFCGK